MRSRRIALLILSLTSVFALLRTADHREALAQETLPLDAKRRCANENSVEFRGKYPVATRNLDAAEQQRL
jgi:hypothetical protein